MPVRRFLPILLLLPLAGGCASTSGNAPPASLYPVEKASGIVLCADGSGGPGGTTQILQQVVAETRAPLRVEMVDWSHGSGRYLADHLLWGNIERSGLALARQIQALRERYPDKKIHLIGQSAGCAVLLVAAEALPPNTVDRIVLLAPSVSTRYDLRPSLRSARQGIDVYYSRHDWVVLGLGMALSGTTDRDLAPAAGRVGFRRVITKPGDEALYAARLRQYEWNPSVAWTGNNGQHFGPRSPKHLQAYVLPLLVGRGSR
jgi:pimeloyl-ACP methyl ester carboxylesterase